MPLGKKSKVGAKGKYREWLTPEALLKIEGWARDGLTEKQIAEKIGITEQTLNVWKNKYSKVLEALKRGKEVVDRQVEGALFKRAIGYQYSEKKYAQVEMSAEEYHARQVVAVQKFKFDNPEATMQEINLVKLGVSKYKSILVEEKTKEVAPDVAAQIFWLKNRKPEEWRDKQQIDMAHSGAVANEIVELTPEERKKRIQELKAKLK